MNLEPPPGFCRPQFPADRAAWREVVEENVYNVPPDLSGAVCVDVGAHIGSFTWLALHRGAKEVHAYEADPRNFVQLRKNLCASDWAWSDDRVAHAHNCAVWRSDRPAGVMALSAFPDAPTANTGGGSMVGTLADPCSQVFTVPTIGLATILQQHEQVHFLKMDCEGSEWLSLSTALPALRQRVAVLAAELHPELAPDPNGGQALIRAMVAHGFKVYLRNQHGLANRPMLYAVNLSMKQR